jgi:hypothetical protein
LAWGPKGSESGSHEGENQRKGKRQAQLYESLLLTSCGPLLFIPFVFVLCERREGVWTGWGGWVGRLKITNLEPTFLAAVLPRSSAFLLVDCGIQDERLRALLLLLLRRLLHVPHGPAAPRVSEGF